MQDDLVARADMLAAIDAMEPIGRRTLQFQIADVGEGDRGDRSIYLTSPVDAGVPILAGAMNKELSE